MSRKKFSLDRRPRRLLSRDPAHFKCTSTSRFAREVLLLSCLPFLYVSWSGGDHANRVLRHGKRNGYLSGNHSSIGGSWPIAISGYPRRHSVKWVTRCRSTQGRSH